MPAGQGLDVAGIAQMILDGVVEHYTDAPAEIALPQRRVIAGGNPRLVAWDCAQCVVTMSGIGLGPAPGTGDAPKAAGGQVSAMGVRHAVYAVQIVRPNPESPDGVTPPDPDDVTIAGLAAMQDAGLLSQALVEVAARVQGGLPKGSRVRPGAVDNLGPEGGFTCSEGSLAVTVGTLV